MKKLLYLILMTSGLIACNGKRDSAGNKSAEDSSAQTQNLIKKFKPIIQGVWVKADYIEKVIKTKSPLAAADKCTGLTTIYINTDHIMGDSIVEMAGYYNHDGANALIKFQPGKSPRSMLFNGRDLNYSVENGDTTITIFQYDDRKQQFIKAKYIRVLKSQPDNNLGYGMDLAINKALVAGKYTLIDSAGTNPKVYFSEDGKVTGLLNFKAYSINVDLNSEPNNNLDEIGFDIRTKNHSSFTFKVDADTLNVYDTYENADSTELLVGKLKYKLVRQR
jgi:hypothetical protein